MGRSQLGNPRGNTFPTHRTYLGCDLWLIDDNRKTKAILIMSYDPQSPYYDSSMDNHPVYGRIEKEEPQPEKIFQLAVKRIETYFGPPMWQVMEKGTDEDGEVGENGEWRYCGALRGLGSSIQNALDDFLDAINETVEEDIKYRWA